MIHDFRFTFGLDCDTLHTILLIFGGKVDEARLKEASDRLKQKSDALQAALNAGKTATT